MDELRKLIEEMRLATSMESPAGMANLLSAGAAALEETLDDEKLTVEDLFAQAALGAVLEAFLEAPGWDDDRDPDRIADLSYRIADAMMKRRKK